MLYLGKKAAKPEAFKLHLNNYKIASGLPNPPGVFGDLAIYDTGRNAVQWGLLGNDICGDCVFAGFIHQLMVWLRSHGGSLYVSSDQAVSNYSAATGYDPKNPATDQGTVVADGCAFWLKSGLNLGTDGLNRITGYAAVAHDPDNLALAAYLFGSVGVGLQLPQSAVDQFGNYMPWDVVPGSANVGGHYVPLVGRNSAGYFLVVTWGRLQAVSSQFLSQYADEAVVCLSSDWVNRTSQLSPRGIAFDQLSLDMSTLGAENG